MKKSWKQYQLTSNEPPGTEIELSKYQFPPEGARVPPIKMALCEARDIHGESHILPYLESKAVAKTSKFTPKNSVTNLNRLLLANMKTI